MSWTALWAWAVVLILQNASFTMVSRARNSGSLIYHAIASVGSNGIWFASQFFVIVSVIDVVRHADWRAGVLYALWYTCWTVIGSVSMHYALMRWIERGKRAVGAR